VAELEAGLAPAGTYVMPSWEQTALSSDQPEKVLVCGWGETAFMCRSGRQCTPSSLLLSRCLVMWQYSIVIYHKIRRLGHLTVAVVSVQDFVCFELL